ncbi:hypothetical protein B0H11DRAFT_2030668 [Mycena galericulata]|nr:hypothetical protein B0H11DRAFT_2083883 [Mycena galericulata]KAJ7477308.1 hypothetical protein B0H11DRAFT_2030668 [Mycena galericulata]
MGQWTRVALAATLGRSLLAQASSVSKSPEQAASACCDTLSSHLPGKVFFPGNASFSALLTRYYSAEERSVESTCRVNPLDAQDVSTTVNILVAGSCQFAVASGAHMFWTGASNIASPGVTIDMRSIDSFSLSSDKKVASVGPGSNWVPVYNNLAQFNLTAVGARSNTVGLGGFLLGGGISNLSPQHGFANDNIVNYQVVLSSGKIIEANATSNADLWLALRAGSTNFGIITRYDISTYPGGVMWGGNRFYNYSQEKEREVSDAFIAFMLKLEEFPLGGASFISGFNDGQDTLVAGFAYDGADGSHTELFSDMLAVTGVTASTLRANVNQVNISAEIDAAFPPGQRTQWGTMTFKANTQLALDVSAKGRELFAPFIGQAGFSFNVGYQSLAAPMLAVSHAKNNPQGLTAANGDLFLLNIFAYWQDASDDAAMNTTLHSLISYANTEAKARGLWNPWLYLNYAFPGEAVYQGYGADNLAQLQRVQKKYDPDFVFETLWSGGFKLPQ